MVANVDSSTAVFWWHQGVQGVAGEGGSRKVIMAEEGGAAAVVVVGGESKWQSSNVMKIGAVI